MHPIFRMRSQISMRRLFDILHAAKRLWRPRFELRQEIEHVIDILTLLVEVKRVVPIAAPAQKLRRHGDRLDRDDAVDVPLQIIAGELDFQMRETVGRDPLGQGFGQSVVNATAQLGVR